MHISPLISPSGEPMFTVGHERSWKQASYRGFNVSLEWVGNGRKSDACMCIWPESNVFVPGSTPGIWLIGRRAITEFVGFTGDDKATGSASTHCLRECREALPMLGKDVNDKNALNALIDVVIRFAPDLVLMPAVPVSIRTDAAGQKLWDLTASDKNTGKVLSEVSV